MNILKIVALAGALALISAINSSAQSSPPYTSGNGEASSPWQVSVAAGQPFSLGVTGGGGSPSWSLNGQSLSYNGQTYSVAHATSGNAGLYEEFTAGGAYWQLTVTGTGVPFMPNWAYIVLAFLLLATVMLLLPKKTLLLQRGSE